MRSLALAFTPSLGLALALSLALPLPPSAMARPQTQASQNQATPPQSQTLSEDTAFKTPGGVSFTAPRDWSITPTPKGFVLTPPEAGSYVILVDAAPEGDARTAVTEAFKAYQADFDRKIQLTAPEALSGGWSAIEALAFETSPREARTVAAYDYRKENIRAHLMANLDNAVAGKRSAALSLISDSLSAPGYSAEQFAGKPAHRLDAARIEQMRAFVEDSMATLGIPGAAFALYDQGQIVYEGGLGVRELGKPETVDKDTLFQVASNTKGMSTLLLAQMVDDGRVGWDQAVVEVYPQFRLGNDETTQKVLIRHLVCACTGLPRKDSEWLFNTPRELPASATFDLLADTLPTSEFGDLYQYNNLMAAAAGYIAGHLAYPELEIGAAFDRAMQVRLFDPLGMDRTTFKIPTTLAENFASPHDFGLSTTPQLAAMDPNYSVVPFRPAGAAWSSAHDMILYVANEIHQGQRPNGPRIVSAENLLKRRQPNVASGADRQYGMGLGVTTTGGLDIVHHGGSMFGYKSDIMLIPEAGVGAVILTNSDSGYSLLAPFRRRLIEILYDAEPKAEAAVKIAAQQTVTGIADLASRLKPASQQAALLATTYDSPELGQLRVEKKGDDILFHFVTFSSQIASRLNEDSTISFVTTEPSFAGLDLVAGEADGKRTLSLLDSQHTYVFTETD